MPSEFDLIRRHFTRPPAHTHLAVGDDAALFEVTPGMQLAVSTDTLVAGVHFFPETDPGDLGWKTLAVNLSDLAAMGAQPRWTTLALTLPRVDDEWLTAFARGFFACAEIYGVDLVGGDTTRGPLAMTATVFGEVPPDAAITRSGGQAGDDLWVSGQPGLAALGLAALRGQVRLAGEARARALAALHHPLPRVELGLALRGIAHAMLDISDGLIGDLAHLCKRSGLAATLEAESLPLAALTATGIEPAYARDCLLAGGDDYELLFAAAPTRRARLTALARQSGLALNRIGSLDTGNGPILISLRTADGLIAQAGGYDHFAQD
ncbi:MAG: thiamine-phosphate kinase [Azoarcus sp.]|jgi:thiamine-monophosphate kinase|nr:thiamine-phosphate kinase [Azoarcus sp.]